jgi:hypothetical protein
MSIQSKIWQNPKIARIMPVDGDSWGEYAELKGTEWESLIPSISEDILDRALHGDATPLMREVREPQGCLKKAPVNKTCSSYKSCASYHKKYCQIEHKKMPDCFSMEESNLNHILISAWRDNYHIVRVI